MSNFLLCAYWGPRRESRDTCAERLGRFGKSLVTWDDSLAQWFRKGMSPKMAKGAVDVTDPTVWTPLLDAGRNRNDFDRAVIEELGFRVGLWNGRSDVACEAGFSIKCGLYAERVSLNSIIVDLPRDLGRLADPEAMMRSLEETVAIWQPDWAGVVSDQAMRMRAFKASRPFVDWMLYLPRPVPELPAPSQVRSVEGGSIVVVQPTPPALEDPEAAARIARIEDALGIPHPMPQTE